MKLGSTKWKTCTLNDELSIKISILATNAVLQQRAEEYCFCTLSYSFVKYRANNIPIIQPYIMCPKIQYENEGILVNAGVLSEKVVVGNSAAPMMKQMKVHTIMIFLRDEIFKLIINRYKQIDKTIETIKWKPTSIYSGKTNVLM